MRRVKPEDDLTDIAMWCLEKMITNMKKKRLSGNRKAKLELLEGAKTSLECSRFK